MSRIWSAAGEPGMPKASESSTPKTAGGSPYGLSWDGSLTICTFPHQMFQFTVISKYLKYPLQLWLHCHKFTILEAYCLFFQDFLGNRGRSLHDTEILLFFKAEKSAPCGWHQHCHQQEQWPGPVGTWPQWPLSAWMNEGNVFLGSPKWKGYLGTLLKTKCFKGL